MNVLRRVVAIALILATGLSAVPAQAAMFSTEAGGAERQRIAAILERESVRDQLAAHGVGIEQAQARVAALTDAEAAELAARIEAMPAGGVDVLGVALVVFLVLLLTDILGYTKIFPFTKPARN